ncbi:MAG: hypothetical protein QF824_02025, partial [Candidatus Woesearchaeota archaeon]|nr:hypothetical protein [Candidatus Woesearchaeota archaeon]
ILFGMLISFLLTSLIPALALADTTTKNSLQSYEVDAFTWLEENSLSDEKVLASVEEGHVITYYSRRMNVMDSNFLLINNINQLYEDVSSIYTTFSQTEAVKLLNKHKVDYLVLSPRVKKEFDIEKLAYFSRQCFEIVYRTEQIKIYKVLCHVEEI